MKNRLYEISALILIVFAAGAVLAFSQQVTAKIPFKFYVEKKVLPAGTYMITLDKPDSRMLTLRRQSSGEILEVPIFTQLARRGAPSIDAYLVFDKVEGKHSLAEVWLPGMDGCFVGGEVMTHTHVTIKAETKPGGGK